MPASSNEKLIFFFVLGLIVLFGLILFISKQYSQEGYSRMDVLPNFTNRDTNRTVATPSWFNTFGPQFGVPRWIETDPPQPFANMKTERRGVSLIEPGDVEGFTVTPKIGERYDVEPNNVLPPFQAENSTYWPSYYYAFPYDKSTYAWPPGMFSRMYNWYPGFSSGTGESYYKRPKKGDMPRPRNAWIRNTKGDDPRYFVSNRGEYQFNQDDYRGF